MATHSPRLGGGGEVGGNNGQRKNVGCTPAENKGKSSKFKAIISETFRNQRTLSSYSINVAAELGPYDSFSSSSSGGVVMGRRNKRMWGSENETFETTRQTLGNVSVGAWTSRAYPVRGSHSESIPDFAALPDLAIPPLSSGDSWAPVSTGLWVT